MGVQGLRVRPEDFLLSLRVDWVRLLGVIRVERGLRGEVEELCTTCRPEDRRDPAAAKRVSPEATIPSRSFLRGRANVLGYVTRGGLDRGEDLDRGRASAAKLERASATSTTVPRRDVPDKSDTLSLKLHVRVPLSTVEEVSLEFVQVSDLGDCERQVSQRLRDVATDGELTLGLRQQSRGVDEATSRN